MRLTNLQKITLSIIDCHAYTLRNAKNEMTMTSWYLIKKEVLSLVEVMQ